MMPIGEKFRHWARSLCIAAALAGLAGCADRTSAPAPQSLTSRNYVLFFRFDSAALSPEAHKIVDQAVEGIEAMKPHTIAIAGYTDKIGSAARNQRLAQRRIAAVEDALKSANVDPKLFLRISLGEDDSDISGTGDRRIEIRLYPEPPPAR